MNDQAGLVGAVSVVTGAASGIGLAVTKRLYREHGVVVAVDRDQAGLERLNRELPHVSTVVADVSSEADTIRYVNFAVEEHGRIDAFVNNAGIEGPATSMLEIDVEDFDRVIAVNVRGMFLGLREVLRVMKRQRAGGAVVNTASVGGLSGGPDFGPYIASKHAVIGLTRAAAHDAAAFGARVNAVAPGVIDTRMTRDLAATSGADWSLEERCATIPFRRYGTADEVANLILWLLGADAAYVTGAVFVIDGGLSA
jgi:NAD(P)-dependent dehydrogenase (short-subunit alcohol dehydrogenase family)